MTPKQVNQATWTRPDESSHINWFLWIKEYESSEHLRSEIKYDARVLANTNPTNIENQKKKDKHTRWNQEFKWNPRSQTCHCCVRQAFYLLRQCRLQLYSIQPTKSIMYAHELILWSRKRSWWFFFSAGRWPSSRKKNSPFGVYAIAEKKLYEVTSLHVERNAIGINTYPIHCSSLLHHYYMMLVRYWDDCERIRWIFRCSKINQLRPSWFNEYSMRWHRLASSSRLVGSASSSR